MVRMKIVIPGGSGQVGVILARHFHARGDDVVVLSRREAAHPWRTVAWDGRTLGPWAREIDGADTVLNLAGRSVNCRYNDANKRAMMDSRIDSTRVVGQAIAAAKSPPRVWLQASTATIYAHRFDAPNDEATGVIGGAAGGATSPESWRFSIEIAKAWEAELNRASTPRTRKVAMRSAMTMSPDRGGIFDTLLSLVRRGLGGTCGSGRQFVSWIHETDFIRAVEWLIKREELSGPINLASPNPLPNEAFMRELRRAWVEVERASGHGDGLARIGLPATALMLELGAVFLRTETELILKSRRVTPRRLIESGFSFEQPEWSAAARELCARTARTG